MSVSFVYSGSLVKGAACFAGIPHTSWIYLMKPRYGRASEEQIRKYLDLCANCGGLGKISLIESFDSLKAALEDKKNAFQFDPKTVWEYKEQNKLWPILLRKEDYRNHNHQVAMGMYLRYFDECETTAKVALKAIDLIEENNGELTPFQLIGMAHYLCDWHDAHGVNTNHTLITNAFTNLPRDIDPKIFDKNVTYALKDAFYIDPSKFNVPPNYSFATSAVSKFAKDLGLKGLKKALDAKLNPEEVKY